MHISISIPGESLPIESARCFGRLLLRLCTRPPKGVTAVSQSFFASSMLPHARQQVVQQALDQGATHVLCLDADMTYPDDLVDELLRHGRPFIACNATTRRNPIRWVAKSKQGDLMDSNERTGLEGASVCGLAVALIERRVFEAIPQPWFNFEHTEKGWIGEDVWFCRRAINSGFRPMIHHELSRKIGHIGSREYSGADAPGGIHYGSGV